VVIRIGPAPVVFGGYRQATAGRAGIAGRTRSASPNGKKSIGKTAGSHFANIP
jgi:hypothetical protein